MKRGNNFNNNLGPKLLNVCVWGVGNQDRVLKHCHVLKRIPLCQKQTWKFANFGKWWWKSSLTPDPIRFATSCFATYDNDDLTMPSYSYETSFEFSTSNTSSTSSSSANKMSRASSVSSEVVNFTDYQAKPWKLPTWTIINWFPLSHCNMSCSSKVSISINNEQLTINN